MVKKEIKLLRRGVPRQEYLDYFLALGKEVEPGRIVGPDWEVVVGQEREAKILNCFIEESEVIFRGEEDVVNELINDFRLKFLRAGG
ncbi:hypothetical protein [Dethiobacter alkaliphilus]|uniref:Molybdopterin cofactor biosynthesis MoaD-related C-terminal domain-containing protein n=1 Tax=Dethiobacter alkaliphilus AHT 1 TaxID=555088 RepID=C0GC03_DETAL|nr:hypothetical protein [Dethiobacter alkaliphilus]EEG78738.1 conserved hypothetical protein [Dethiobacter alkaliphilus AHT 1]